MKTDFRLLGPLEVLVDGQPVELGGPRQRALLAMLLTRPGVTVSRDALVDGLWGDDPPASAANVLQTYVSHLRKALPADRLFTRPPGYVLEVEEGELDLHRFERLATDARQLLLREDAEQALNRLDEALALWRGPPLAGLGDAPFAAIQAARLGELRLAVLEDRFDAILALGNHARAVGDLEELVAAEPLRERLRAQLMLALYRSGRQHDALAVYRDTRSLLVDELGIEPAQALRDLHAAILRQDPALDAPATGRAAPTIRTLLAIGFEAKGFEALLSLTQPMAQRPPHEVVLVLLVPDAQGLAEAARSANLMRTTLEGSGIGARAAAFTSDDPGPDIERLVSDSEVSVLLLDAVGRLGAEGRLDPLLVEILASVPSDVALLVRAGPASGDAAAPVLVPFGGADHEWAAVELGAWIASAEDRPLRLAGVEADPAAGRRDASRLLARASLLVQQVTGVATEPVLVAPGSDELVTQTEAARVAVVGLPDGWQARGIGQTRADLAARASSPVLLVRGAAGAGGLAPSESLTRFTWTIGAGS